MDSSKEIQDILYSILGLQINEEFRNGRIVRVISRQNKPLFTDEYARNICGDLRGFLNFTVQVSRFDDIEIIKKVRYYLIRLATSFATHGDDAYISDASWHKILDIHTNETNAAGVHNGWEKFGIMWSYNDPCTSEMLNYVKDVNEEADQAVEFDRLLSVFSSIIHASFNKSFSPNPQTAGMLLGSMTQIRTESQIIRESEKKRWSPPVFGGQ